MKNNFACAHLKNLRISPYKLNDIAKPIRHKSVVEALALLRGMKKRAAEDVSKTLLSAMANAKNNNGLDVDKLFVSEATVGRSMALRRMDIKGRSRSGRITKPFSHLSVIVEERDFS